MLELLLAVSFAASCFMTGLIWFVQIVHYPLMASVGASEAAAYAERHQQRTTFVVGPVMLAEAVTGVMASVMLATADVWDGAAVLVHGSLVVLLFVWLSTFAVQVPRHTKLLGGGNATMIASLVRTNWIRTVGWTARSVMLGVVLFTGP